MAIIKCKMCGGSLEVTPGTTVAECEFCGTKQTLPKVNDEVIQNLFNRANNFRLKCEFDKAMQIYEKIVQMDDSEAEAHWGIVLCKYGIEYVEDPKTFKRIPTCHRTLFEAVTTDADYLAAVDYSDTAQQTIYESEARAIDRIQKDILAIVKNEKPFDVFICYKETDENGKRTVDSALANDIYHQLTQEGMKVFYAAITLEDKLGQEYEPYIFAALNSAKVMLVIGTKPEYFSAVWVKNEWSRFMKLMKTDRSKLLIPCYKDMDAYDLPEEFAHLQAQDMSKIGFINDVVRGIRKVVVKEEPQVAMVKETVVTGGNANTAPLLKRAFMFLEDGDWTRADDFCEQVLNVDPECAQAYLGKLMAELRVHKQENLKDCDKPFAGNNNYKKAIRFANAELKAELDGYIEHINTRNENARLDGIYTRAKKAMAEAKTGKDYRQAAQQFETIPSYQDSAVLANECYEKAETAKKDDILKTAIHAMSHQTEFGYADAIQIISKIPGWKNADALLAECKQKLEEIEAKAEAERLKKERQAEIARKEAERIAKRNKKIAIIATPIVCAIIAFVIVLNTVIIPNNKYNDAIALMDAGKYTEAIAAFEAMNGYKDSVDKINECNTAILDGKYSDAIALVNEGKFVEAYDTLIALDGYKDSEDKANSIYDDYKGEKLKTAKVGGYVFFGAYEQDNNTSNGKEDIEWLVLEVTDGKALVISKYALDCKQYNTSYTDVTWETCSLREWLNSDFINSAFFAEEQALIHTVTVSADINPDYPTDPGNATQDKIFILSWTECEKYMSNDIEMDCKPTDYAVANGVYVDSSDGNCGWWTRSDNAIALFFSGDDVGNLDVFGNVAVRPAMWIDWNA